MFFSFCVKKVSKDNENSYKIQPALVIHSCIFVYNSVKFLQESQPNDLVLFSSVCITNFIESIWKKTFHNYLLHFFLLLSASDKLTSSNLPFFYLLFLIFLHAILIFLHSKFLTGQFSVVLMIHNEQAGLSLSSPQLIKKEFAF